MRTRGSALVTVTAVSQAHGGAQGAFGLGIVSLQAFNAGQVSIPSPITNDDWDGWLVHQMFNVASITATIGDGVNSEGVTQRFNIDSKAMRKTGLNEVLVGVFEFKTEFGTATVKFDALTRLLLKLP